MDRQLSFKIKSIEDSGEIEGFVSIYGNKDLNGDIVEPGSFTKTLQESGGEVVLLLHHDRTRPIGLARLTDETKGLRLHGSIATDLPDGKLAHAQAKKGLLLILSVLYLPGGLASLRWDTWKLWRDDIKRWWRERRYEWSGDKARDKRLARERRLG